MIQASQRSSSRLSFVHTVIALVGICVFGVIGCGGGNVYEPPPPPSVTMAKPIQQTVTVYMEENGLMEAVERAEIRVERVQGILNEIKFTPGAEVNKDALLYIIDQRQYIAARNAENANLSSAKASLSAAKAAIDVANSELAVAEVAVVRTESEFNRQDRLLKENATSRSQWETARAERDGSLAARDAATANIAAAHANVETAIANVEKAEADRHQADLDLGYTEVSAPIDGRITNTEVKIGNLVQHGVHLATVVKRKPIYAYFNISERYLLALEKESRSERDEEFDVTTVKVDLRRAGDDGFPFSGNLDYIDQEGVDQSTGTLRVRAVFENTNQRLLPGFFVRVRVPIGKMEDALLVPEKVISRDQAGSYLLVVAGENKVERKNVAIGPKYGDMVVIEEGLLASDSVVIEGLQRARPGATVDPQTTELSPPQQQEDLAQQEDDGGAQSDDDAAP